MQGTNQAELLPLDYNGSVMPGRDTAGAAAGARPVLDSDRVYFRTPPDYVMQPITTILMGFYASVESLVNMKQCCQVEPAGPSVTLSSIAQKSKSKQEIDTRDQESLCVRKLSDYTVETLNHGN